MGASQATYLQPPGCRATASVGDWVPHRRPGSRIPAPEKPDRRCRHLIGENVTRRASALATSPHRGLTWKFLASNSMVGAGLFLDPLVPSVICACSCPHGAVRRQIWRSSACAQVSLIDVCFLGVQGEHRVFRLGDARPARLAQRPTPAPTPALLPCGLRHLTTWSAPPQLRARTPSSRVS